MKEKIKNNLPMLIGMLVAMVIVDILLNNAFDLMDSLIKVITTIVVYFTFCFIEMKLKRK